MKQTYYVLQFMTKLRDVSERRNLRLSSHMGSFAPFQGHYNIVLYEHDFVPLRKFRSTFSL